MSKEVQKNPALYGYVGDELITITAMDYVRLRGAIEAFLGKETTVSYPEKYRYVNKETGEPIKVLTEKNKPLARKIVDFEATMGSNPAISRTEEGLELLEIKFMMEGIHIKNIEEGIAKHKSFFDELNAKQNEAPMSVVKDDPQPEEESTPSDEVEEADVTQTEEAPLGETKES